MHLKIKIEFCLRKKKLSLINFKEYSFKNLITKFLYLKKNMNKNICINYQSPFLKQTYFHDEFNTFETGENRARQKALPIQTDIAVHIAVKTVFPYKL